MSPVPSSSAPRHMDTIWTRSIIVLICSFYLFYLFYRVQYTINWNAPISSFLLLYAEIHGFISLFLFCFQIWRPILRQAPPTPEGLSVDVYIPTYNEPPELLRKTIVGCLNIRYPHKTYVLDDGNRSEVRALAKELGCGYITRTDRTGNKAGNLNNAMKQTDGDFILFLDADDVPKRNILDKTLGYFEQDDLAFVQIPQHPYNTDTFSFYHNDSRQEVGGENDLFFKVVMPGMDYWGTAYCVGTGAIFRRKALDEIGGWATDSITEDLHTSMHLYQKGWKSVYHAEELVSGLAVADLSNYHKQKLRWCEGNVQNFLSAYSLTNRKMSWGQKISLLGVLFSWFNGFPKLVFFIIPSLMLLTGQAPIANYDIGFFVFYALFLSTVLLGVKVACHGHLRQRSGEKYDMLNSFRLIRGVLQALFKKTKKFAVTKKPGTDKTPSPIPYLFPQLSLVLVNYIAVVWGGLMLFFDLSNDVLGLSIASFWAAYNGYNALDVVRSVLKKTHQRGVYRVEHTVPVALTLPDGQRFNAVTVNLNERGLLLSTEATLPAGTVVDLGLQLGDETVNCRGEIRHAAFTKDKTIRKLYGVLLKEISAETADKITLYCFNVAIPHFFDQRAIKPSRIRQLLSRMNNRWRYQRTSTRYHKALPLRLTTSAIRDPILVATEDVSTRGLSFMAVSDIPQESEVSITFPDTDLTVDATVRQKRYDDSSGLHRYGLQFHHISKEGEQKLRRLCTRLGGMYG